jgi:hypothetical protein
MARDVELEWASGYRYETADQITRGKVEMGVPNQCHEQWSVLKPITLMIGITIEPGIPSQPETDWELEADRVIPLGMERFPALPSGSKGVIAHLDLNRSTGRPDQSCVRTDNLPNLF